LPGEKGVKQLRRIALTVAIIAALFSLQFVPSGYFTVYPGPVIRLSDVVAIEEYSQEGDSFHMVSVLAKDASVLEFLKAAFDKKVGLWSKKQVLGGRSIDEYMDYNRKSMVESQRTAIYIALKAQGIDVSNQGAFPITVRIESGQVAGPSAGLAFALEILNRMGYDIIQGRKIACTGVLNYEGLVQGVGGVAQKTIACRAQGIEIFVVPMSNYDEALLFAGDMTVFGVTTFDEALTMLSQELNP
jgi:PDZ domain-containing secreted protein